MELDLLTIVTGLGAALLIIGVVLLIIVFAYKNDDKHMKRAGPALTAIGAALLAFRAGVWIRMRKHRQGVSETTTDATGFDRNGDPIYGHGRKPMP